MKPFASTRSLASVKSSMFYRAEEYPFMRSPYSWTSGKGKNVDPFFPPFSKCFGLLAQNGLRFVRPSPVFKRKPCKTFSDSCPLLSLLGHSLVHPHGS